MHVITEDTITAQRIFLGFYIMLRAGQDSNAMSIKRCRIGTGSTGEDNRLASEFTQGVRPKFCMMGNDEAIIDILHAFQFLHQQCRNTEYIEFRFDIPRRFLQIHNRDMRVILAITSRAFRSQIGTCKQFVIQRFIAGRIDNQDIHTCHPFV